MAAAVSPTMMPTSRMPASRMAASPKKSTGLLATGTSCLALVWVIGRRRVPLPPERIRPFTAGAPSVDPGPELAVVPGRARALAELQRDALGSLREHHRPHV